MKKILITFLMVSTLGLVGKVAAETETTCVRNGAGEIVANVSENPVTDTDGNSGDSCKEIPDFYKINVFRFGLCSADPFPATDLSSCEFLVNSDAGVEHVITYPNESRLRTNSEMATGTYGYMVLLLENRVGIRHTESFSVPVTGATGTGQQCWTIDSTTAFFGQRSGVLQEGPDTPAMDCGDTPAPAYSYEIYDGLGGDVNDEETPIFAAIDDDPGNLVPNGRMYAKLLKADNVTTATSFQDAGRMLVSIALATPKSIQSNSQFQLRFKMTDSVSVDLDYDEGTDVLYAVKNGADPFQIDLVITNN